MSGLLERIAQAIAGDNWSDLSEADRMRARLAARRVIAAMGDDNPCEACARAIHNLDPDRPGVATHTESYQNGYSHGLSDAESLIRKLKL